MISNLHRKHKTEFFIRDSGDVNGEIKFLKVQQGLHIILLINDEGWKGEGDKGEKRFVNVTSGTNQTHLSSSIQLIAI